MVILDTNVVSEMLRPAPDPAVICWLAGQDGGRVYLTAITEAELRFGVALIPAGRRRDVIAAAVDAIMREDFLGRILPFNSAAAAAYASIATDRWKMGRPISQSDAQIAAIARVHEATVATRNVPDFENCGVEIIDPWRTPA